MRKGIPYADTPYKALRVPEIRVLFKYRFPLAQIKRLQPHYPGCIQVNITLAHLWTGYTNVFWEGPEKGIYIFHPKAPMDTQV
jgi:hypothetical protein